MFSSPLRATIFVVLFITAVVLACCCPVSVADNSYVESTMLVGSIDGYVYRVARVIDLQAGVVCYTGDDWGHCFLLEDTDLDY